MPSYMEFVPSSGGAGTFSATGLDTTESLALGMELKFILLGQPLTDNMAFRDRLSETLMASKAQLHRQAYAWIARVVGDTNDSSRNGSANGNGSALVQPYAVSRDEVLDAGRQEREYWPTHWIVKKANSVEHTKDDPSPDLRRTNGIAVPVEISSPILPLTDPCSPFMVKEVVSRITTFPVAVNHTCDFHVHVGRRDGKAFTLPTLKKLATVLWLAEPLLRSVRDPKSLNFSNRFTWGSEQRRYSRLALALDRQPAAGDGVNVAEAALHRVRSRTGLHRDSEDEWYLYMGNIGSQASRNEALRAIWQVASPRELGLLLSGAKREHRRLGFNFSAFGEEDERALTNPRTIEFRVLEGTLNSDLILGWLHICGKLLQLCMKCRQSHFHEVVRYLLSQQHIYEDLRMIDYRTSNFGNFGSRRFDMQPPEREAYPARPRRDMLFAELMKHIGVEAAAYVPFQLKMRKEYGSE